MTLPRTTFLTPGCTLHCTAPCRRQVKTFEAQVSSQQVAGVTETLAQPHNMISSLAEIQDQLTSRFIQAENIDCDEERIF